MFGGGASTQKMVCLFEEMGENEEEEIDASVVSTCLLSMALFIRASWSDRSRSVQMEDKNEKEDEGVREGG